MGDNDNGVNLTCGMCDHCGSVKDDKGRVAQDRGECRLTRPQVVMFGVVAPNAVVGPGGQPQVTPMLHSIYPPVMFSNTACGDFEGGEEAA